MRTGIFITGSGVVSCAGNSPERLWENCAHGNSGIVDGIGFVREAFDDGGTEGDITRFALGAARPALRQSGWNGLDDDDALLLATTTGNLPVWENKVVEHLRGRLDADAFREFFRRQPLGSVLTELRAHLGREGRAFRGRASLVSSACSAATQALALAAMWIENGEARRVLVIGTEVLCQLTREGFGSLQLLTTEMTRPFDRDRNGINLSEGAGAFCLEKNPTSRALARLSGYGITSDGYHMTSPHPEGTGSLRAMRDAIERAGIAPREIAWVHAHGTGSRQNDAAEAAALRTLFGDRTPPVTSTKNIHGHALGASGAIESTLCLEAIRRQRILPNLGHRIADPELSIALANGDRDFNPPVSHILKNTLGFGGANAALVFSEVRV